MTNLQRLRRAWRLSGLVARAIAHMMMSRKMPFRSDAMGMVYCYRCTDLLNMATGTVHGEPGRCPLIVALQAMSSAEPPEAR